MGLPSGLNKFNTPVGLMGFTLGLSSAAADEVSETTVHE
jgi:hypothetical protein